MTHLSPQATTSPGPAHALDERGACPPSTTLHAPLIPGDILADRFELQHQAGSGGMGQVWKARDRASGEAVALKVLLEESASTRARFLREAEALAELCHPAIVRYVAHGTAASGAPFLAMEWLLGEDLGAMLGHGALPLDETVTAITRAADALAAVHARGIVHRDVKPSNLFLVQGDVRKLKLLDFGIAKLPRAARMTQSGALVGTLGYMAPEQTDKRAPIDARTDVFALGCVLYECLIGEPPFAAGHLVAVLAKLLLADAPRPRERRPDVPPALDALCASMLARDPADRPPNGAAVRAALTAAVLSMEQN